MISNNNIKNAKVLEYTLMHNKRCHGRKKDDVTQKKFDIVKYYISLPDDDNNEHSIS